MKSRPDCDNLHRSLDDLFEWGSRWQMRFHPDKCLVLRLGQDPPEYDYTMLNSDGTRMTLKVVSKERVLGVIIDNKLNFQAQCRLATSKAFSVLGVIRRTFTYLDEKTLLLLYKSMVRPKLEYAVSVWSPNALGLIDDLERVQHWATKMISRVKDLEYEDRLKHLKLPSLLYRRLRGDMIMTYQILHKNTHVPDDLLPLHPPDDRTRGHSLKLRKDRVSKSVRRNFYSSRVINDWNLLPESVISAPTVNCFKSRLDRHWRDRRHDTRPTSTLMTRPVRQ